MEIILQRENSVTGTFGTFCIEYCHKGWYSLEPGRHDGKGPIPAGRYQVELRYSPHFDKLMPHLLDVPGFENILIHVGNYISNTEGCILVGRYAINNMLTKSEDAFDVIYAYIESAINGGNKVWINILEPQQKQPSN